MYIDASRLSKESIDVSDTAGIISSQYEYEQDVNRRLALSLKSLDRTHVVEQRPERTKGKLSGRLSKARNHEKSAMTS